MKKHLSLILLLTILVSGCNQEEILKNESANGKTFTALFEQNESRTYVEEGNLLRWTKGDLISLFNSNTLNQQYKFDGETGANSGTFSKVESPFGTGNELNCHYAVYPYASEITISEGGVLTAILPAEQSYAANSFGLGANTMVAVTEGTDDTFLKFQNVGGYLKLQLYGDDITVKSITLTGNNNEKLAGVATINPVYGQDPTISMDANAIENITLDCGEGVKIGSTAETATAFWIVVPPTKFANGFEVTITDVDNNKITKSTSNDISIARNVIKPMEAIEVKVSAPQIDGEVFNTKLYSMASNNLSNVTQIIFKTNSIPSTEAIEVSKGVSMAIENGVVTVHINAKKAELISGKDMFNYCKELTNIEGLKNLDTSKATDMSGMFYECRKLTTLDLSCFDTSNVEDMSYMFNACVTLRSLNISSFDTSKVTTMQSMFQACYEIVSLDLSKFNTYNVTNMCWMFAGLKNATLLKLDSFLIQDETNITDMFKQLASTSQNCTLSISETAYEKIKNLITESYITITHP